MANLNCPPKSWGKKNLANPNTVGGRKFVIKLVKTLYIHKVNDHYNNLDVLRLLFVSITRFTAIWNKFWASNAMVALFFLAVSPSLTPSAG